MGFTSILNLFRIWWSLTPPFHPYPSTSSGQAPNLLNGGLLSAALSMIRCCEPPRVRGHPVLRCPDFPLSGCKHRPRVTIRPTQFLINDLIYRIIFTIKKSSAHITVMNSSISTNFRHFLHRNLSPTSTATIPGKVHDSQSIPCSKNTVVY